MNGSYILFRYVGWILSGTFAAAIACAPPESVTIPTGPEVEAQLPDPVVEITNNPGVWPAGIDVAAIEQTAQEAVRYFTVSWPEAASVWATSW